MKGLELENENERDQHYERDGRHHKTVVEGNHRGLAFNLDLDRR